jgi:hypothetical protein
VLQPLSRQGSSLLSPSSTFAPKSLVAKSRELARAPVCTCGNRSAQRPADWAAETVSTCTLVSRVCASGSHRNRHVLLTGFTHCRAAKGTESISGCPFYVLLAARGEV